MGFGIRQRSTTPLLSAAQLQELGVAVVIYPRLLTACAVMGMQHGLELLQQSVASGKVVDRPDALVSFEVLHDILGMHEIEAMEQRFLTPDQLRRNTARARRPGRAGNAAATAPRRPDAMTANCAHSSASTLTRTSCAVTRRWRRSATRRRSAT